MIRARRGRSAVLAATLLAGGCAYLLAHRDVLTFSHASHLERGLDCEACHSGIGEAVESQGRHLPTMETCGTCHSEIQESKCDKCHTHPDHARAVRGTRTDLKFSHKAHLERVSGDCSLCHPAKKATKSLDRIVPSMETCESCHDEPMAKLDCTFCHKDLSQIARSPSGFLVHRQGWARDHGTLARNAPGTCAQCHEPSHCASCHSRKEELTLAQRNPEGVERQLIHRGDWITRHGADARLDQASCLKCHGVKGCADCHAREGVAPLTPGGISRHPAGWLDPGSPTFHGTAARREIVACAACHDQGALSNCVACHQVGGSGGNPHPAGWSSSLNEHRASACTPCHGRM